LVAGADEPAVAAALDPEIFRDVIRGLPLIEDAIGEFALGGELQRRRGQAEPGQANPSASKDLRFMGARA